MNENELYHYGVKGMKWGVRRQQVRSAKADRKIGQTGRLQAANKALRASRDASAEAKYYGGRTKIRNTFINRALDKADAKNLARAKAYNQASYESGEIANRYYIARQKARKDKTYKQSSEYKSAKKAHTKNVVRTMVWGEIGAMNIRANEIRGDSGKKAKAKEFVRQALGGMA